MVEVSATGTVSCHALCNTFVESAAFKSYRDLEQLITDKRVCKTGNGARPAGQAKAASASLGHIHFIEDSQ